MFDADFVKEIMGLAKPPTVTVGDDDYILDGYSRATKPTQELVEFENKCLLEVSELQHKQRIQKAQLSFNALHTFSSITTLQSLCDILKAEIDCNAAAFPLFVNVTTFNSVEVWGSYEVDFSRRHLYSAKSDNQELNFSDSRDGKLDIESAIIALQTKFQNTDDIPYVLETCGKISLKSEVTQEDNGISQQITINKGVALVGKAQVKSRVTLRPFRTFIEVEQPPSEYLLRFHDGGFISLSGADGGAWKLKAKANIAAFLSEQLADLISNNKVKVLQ